MNLQNKIIEAKKYLGDGIKLIEGATVYVSSKNVIYLNILPKGIKQLLKLIVKKGIVYVYDENEKQIEPIKPSKDSSKLRNATDEKPSKDS